MVFTMMFSIIAVNTETLLAYNMRAEHKVNQKIDLNKEKKEIWGRLRGMGYSEAATAGIMGNWMAESSCNRTVTQGHIPWSSFRKGYTGLGLAQWTSSGRQDNLFKMADKHKTQWMDLNVQLELFEKEMKGYGFKSVGGLDGFKKLTDVNKAAVVFHNVYERSADTSMTYRKSQARKSFKKYTGLDPITSSSDSSTLSGKEAKKVISEWDLEGMPAKSGLLEKTLGITLPSYNELSVGEQYSVSSVKNDLVGDKQYEFYDFIRTCVAFLGLCTIVYALFLMVAYLFDKANIFFDLGLVQALTLGKLKYSDEIGAEDVKGIATGTKIVKIASVCMIVGFLVVSGSLFSLVVDVLYWVYELMFS